jgi:hypothetical protein
MEFDVHRMNGASIGGNTVSSSRTAYQSAVRAPVQIAQNDAPQQPAIPRPSGVWTPGTRENDELTRGLIGSTIRAGRAIGDAIGGILHNEENVARPPAGSRPINETPWSGDHDEIKEAVGARANDDVRISPDGEVWQQHPDGTWTNHGPAKSPTGSGKPSGRRGKDRERW